MPLLPFDDDLYYISPIPSFETQGLLPTAAQWRPLDYLFRVLLGFAPGLYPLANHVAVVLGHVLNIGLIHHILVRQLGARERAAFLPCAFFGISAAVFVGVASVDSLNQVYSVLFGLAAVSLLLREPSAPRTASAVLCCFVSVFWKESGIVFFVVAPLLSLALPFLFDERPTAARAARPLPARRTVALVGVGLVCCAAYFVARFMLMGQVVLGESTGRYTMSLSPVGLLRNLAVLFAANFSAIDSLAVFIQPRNLPLVALTTAGSLPFVVWLLTRCARVLRTRHGRVAIGSLLAIALVGISPYLCISAGEMHAYQLTPFVVFLLAFLMDEEGEPSRMLLVVFAVFFATTLVTDAHKWIGMYQLGQDAREIADRVAAEYDQGEHPQHVAAFALETSGEQTYSVFRQSIPDASEAGQGAAAAWGWRYPETFTLYAVTEELDTPTLLSTYADQIAGCDSVWVVSAEGDVSVLRQGEDY